MPSHTKGDLTVAMTSYRRGDYNSIRSCSKAFKKPYTTLQTHLNQQKLLSESHENQ
jgi:CMP-N-acetylneuraminic acid synthetase